MSLVNKPAKMVKEEVTTNTTQVLVAKTEVPLGGRSPAPKTSAGRTGRKRLADLAKKDGQGRLRIAPKGFMQDIVERFNLRSMFETEEVRDKLKMAGLRGQAPLVAYLFFRLAMPIIIAVIALCTCS